MSGGLPVFSLAGTAPSGILITPAVARKTDGTCWFHHRDSQASGAFRERAAVLAVTLLMAVVNNLVLSSGPSAPISGVEEHFGFAADQMCEAAKPAIAGRPGDIH